MSQRRIREARSPRAQHEAAILDELRRRGRASRGDLVTLTRLSRATVSSITGDLIRSGHIVRVEAAPTSGGVGRTPEHLTLNPTAGLVVGLDIGHRRVRGVVADAAHAIVASGERLFDPSAGWADRIERSLDLAATLLDRSTADDDAPMLAAIGVGVAGTLPTRHRIIAHVERRVGERFGVPVRTDNNARLAGLAESVWGAAQDADASAYMRLSDGIGGAIVLDRRIHHGRNGRAGEFGHLCVDPVGPRCRCGNLGCLEAFVGLRAVLAEAGAQDVRSLASMIDAGNLRAQAATDDAGTRVGLVLANVITALDLDEVVLGGELAALGDRLVRPVRRELDRHVLADEFDRVRVRLARLGDLDGALGGVALVLYDRTIALHRTATAAAMATPAPLVATTTA
ncbi:ROK family transcriptional regulator [Curtobacterium sp. VKM Ac-1376]|uniref:ROK family transcriptional regulator n=1 Tax=Curtobacterium sp. VKM Ac-1376 TaxID=123312 RepID=UPI00188CF5F9|nr:ROK family protein [Curtobacterium sp. VKM Ac-1376]MBF4613610.1 ROK family transcriptional regulator [Curtobacterium sp. VKM Ac-1376]